MTLDQFDAEGADGSQKSPSLMVIVFLLISAFAARTWVILAVTSMHSAYMVSLGHDVFYALSRLNTFWLLTLASYGIQK